MSEMKAGRELDKCVAEQVMGCEVFSIGTDETGLQEARGDGATRNLPHYSTDIAAAWQVVEKLAPYFKISYMNSVRGLGWHCELHGRRAVADTAPLAICLAALKVVTPPSTPSPTPQSDSR